MFKARAAAKVVARVRQEEFEFSLLQERIDRHIQRASGSTKPVKVSLQGMTNDLVYRAVDYYEDLGWSTELGSEPRGGGSYLLLSRR